jgi:hypothetical protein
MGFAIGIGISPTLGQGVGVPANALTSKAGVPLTSKTNVILTKKAA